MARELSWSEGNRLIRETGSEDYLAARITDERERRGWSQSELSRRLNDIGASIHQTAISKIEKPADERRAITVDEAIAFAKVFDVALGELLLPPEIVGNAEFGRALDVGLEYLREAEKARGRYAHHIDRMAQRAVEDDAWLERIDTRLDWLAERNADNDANAEPAPMEQVLLDVLGRWKAVVGKQPRRGRRSR